MNTAINASKWVDYYTPAERPDFRLFCIPFAGGGASKYAPWKWLVPKSTEIVPIQLAGRERRVRDPFEYDLVTVAESVSAAVSEISGDGVPFSVFGHSMGGIIAFETVKVLEKNGIKADRCIISATDLDGISRLSGIREMSDDDLLKMVSAYGAAHDLEILKQFPQYFSMLMRIIRADFIMLENYEMDTTHRISAPITALYSDDDRLVGRETMNFWKNMTEAEFNIHGFHGNHFYLFDDSAAVLDTILNENLSAQASCKDSF